jgi:hypothetical protein
MDNDGRVLRFDSLSKILSSGLRVRVCERGSLSRVCVCVCVYVCVCMCVCVTSTHGSFVRRVGVTMGVRVSDAFPAARLLGVNASFTHLASHSSDLCRAPRR